MPKRKKETVFPLAYDPKRNGLKKPSIQPEYAFPGTDPALKNLPKR